MPRFSVPVLETVVTRRYMIVSAPNRRSAAAEAFFRPTIDFTEEKKFVSRSTDPLWKGDLSSESSLPTRIRKSKPA